MSDSMTQGACFVDANVWIYAFIQSQDLQKHTLSKALLQSHEIVISTQVINEVCVNLVRKANFDEISICSLIDSFYSKYRVVEIAQETLKTASSLRSQYRFSFWDSLIVACALIEKVPILYSEDMHTGLVVENQLRILNPFNP